MRFFQLAADDGAKALAGGNLAVVPGVDPEFFQRSRDRRDARAILLAVGNEDLGHAPDNPHSGPLPS